MLEKNHGAIFSFVTDGTAMLSAKITSIIKKQKNKKNNKKKKWSACV